MKPAHGNCDQYMQEGQPCSGWQCLQAERDALREALELIAAPRRPDGTWNRDREACRQLAAEALAAAPIIPPGITADKPQWIACSERMPEEHIEVLVYQPGCVAWVAWHDKDNGGWHDGLDEVYAVRSRHWGHGGQGLQPKPTHWMPLPAAPRSE